MIIHKRQRKVLAMIVDSHAHIFPCLDGSKSSDSSFPQLLYLQKFVSDSPAQSVRRLKDNIVEEDRSLWTLWNENEPGLEGALDVNFRVGKFGRLEWTKKGVDYFMHLYGPTLQDMTATPEYMLAEMDYIGVGTAVLQNAWLYGRLNDFFAEAQRRYPDRFIGTVQIHEARAYEKNEITELIRGVRELGLKALYYGTPRFFETRYKDHIDDQKFHVFWDEVRDLAIPVFWDITGSPEPKLRDKTPYERFLVQMRRFENWRQHYPEIPCILVHGVPLRYIRKGDELMPIPEELWSIWKKPNVNLELLFPMQVSHPVQGGRAWEYPYAEVHPLIKQLYDKLGPEKLVWGSDIPNIERNCTYRQGLDYLRHHCTFLSASDKNLLFSGNILRLLDING